MTTTNLTELAEYFPDTSGQKPQRVGGIKRIYKEYYAQWMPDAKVWEIFTEAECEGYIGCADTLAEARAIAHQHEEQD